jgi:hypothetical protein
VRDKLAFSFEDMGEQQVKNIARPIRVHPILLDERPDPSEPTTAVPPKAPLTLPDKPSIAVLPFQNMSADPEQEYFADGMVEETTSQNPDPSNSAAFRSPARCQVDSLMDFFGLAVNRFYNFKLILVRSLPLRCGWIPASVSSIRERSDRPRRPATSADTDPAIDRVHGCGAQPSQSEKSPHKQGCTAWVLRGGKRLVSCR